MDAQKTTTSRETTRSDIASILEAMDAQKTPASNEWNRL